MKAVVCTLFLSRGAWAKGCESSHDCGLLGECDVPSGKCVCDAGWTSENCTKLDFLPTAWGPSRQAYMNNASSWGGNAVKSSDGQYHLFFSEIKENGLHDYRVHSQATHAVASSPFGPFTKKRVVRAPMSHNVQPQAGPDGAVYIFMIHREPDPTAEPHGPLCVGRADEANAEFEWVLPEMYYENGTAVDKTEKVDNPTAIIYNNGTVLLMVRGSAMYTAPSWRGPFTRFTEDALGCGNPKEECSVEDPFIWQSPRGLHMLAHDHKPFAFHMQVTAYAFTADVSGRSGWTFSSWPAAEARNISFDDGTTHAFCSQQRPQLHFSEPARDGVQHGHLVAFFSGVQQGPLTENKPECGYGDPSEFNPYPLYSFTMVQPLAVGSQSVMVV